MKTINAITLKAFLTLAIAVTLAEGAERLTRRRPPRSREEEDARYRKPFAIILAALFLAVAPVLVRFVHCLATDPVVPRLLNELTRRGKRLLAEKFGNLERRGGSVGKED
jgi:hypothetical protein